MSTRDELNRAADLNRRVDNAGGMDPFDAEIVGAVDATVAAARASIEEWKRAAAIGQEQLAAAYTEIAILRARVAEVERERDEAQARCGRESERLQGYRDAAIQTIGQRDAALARVGVLESALDQADRWILYRTRVPDGACKECFPEEDIPPAFAGFRCAWHWAQARAALSSPPPHDGEGAP